MLKAIHSVNFGAVKYNKQRSSKDYHYFKLTGSDRRKFYQFFDALQKDNTATIKVFCNPKSNQSSSSIGFYKNNCLQKPTLDNLNMLTVILKSANDLPTGIKKFLEQGIKAQLQKDSCK